MSKVNWHKHTEDNGQSSITHEDLCAWLLLELIVHNKKLDKKLASGELNLSELNVALSIDRVEIDFEAACEIIERGLQGLAIQNAKKLLSDKLQGMYAKLIDLDEQLDEFFNDVFSEDGQIKLEYKPH